MKAADDTAMNLVYNIAPRHSARLKARVIFCFLLNYNILSVF